MAKVPMSRIISSIEQIARPTMLREFRPDCCIATTRTLIRVLRHFGYEPQAIPVRTMIYNRIMVEAIHNGTVKHDDDPDFFSWCNRIGAWSVGIGFPIEGKTNGFVGHLIAALPKQKMFIDASLDQASRPARDLDLPRVLVSRLTDEFLTTPGERLEFDGTNGAVVIYERIANEEWRTSPDWRDASRTKHAMKTIIGHIEKGLTT